MFVVAAVVLAGAVTIDEGAVEVLFHDLCNRKLGSSAMNFYAELVEQFYSSCTKTSADDIGAIVGGDETRQNTMLMFGSFENLSVGDHAGDDSYDS